MTETQRDAAGRALWDHYGGDERRGVDRGWAALEESTREAFREIAAREDRA